MRIFLTLIILVPSIIHAADPTKPHNHTGVVKPYEGAPPTVSLNIKELKKLNSGEAVFKQTESKDDKNGGKAIAVFKVKASPKIVWQVLGDFENYPKYIPDLDSTKIYKKDGDKIFVEFTIKKFFTSTTYYIKHNFPMEKEGWGTWTLDYSRLSDLDESVGFWRVSPIKGRPNESIVYYSADLRIKGVLSLLRGFIEEKGLKQATQWVKTVAEDLAQNTPKASVAELDKTKGKEIAQSK